MTKATLTKLVIADLGEMPSSHLDFDFGPADAMRNLPLAQDGTGTALQISSQLIRTEWRTPQGRYELQISGTVGPIASLDQLQGAMDRSLAGGAITRVRTLLDGKPILDVEVATEGWRVTSGAQVVTLKGDMPDTFSEAYDLQDVLAKAGSFDQMTAAEGADWLQSVTGHGVTAIELRDGDRVVFGFQQVGDLASMHMGGFDLSVTGVLGVATSALAAGMIGLLQGIDVARYFDLSQVQGLGLGTLTLQDASGRVLVTISDMEDAGQSFQIGTRSFDEWVIGRSGAEDLAGRSGEIGTILSGFGGNDRIWGQEGNDALYGGTGDDTLFAGLGDDLIQGGKGIDTAVFGATTGVHVDLRLGGVQDTGMGRDQLIGIENLAAGTGDDWLHGNGGANLLLGFGGNDTLDGGAGNDTLTGGMGADQLIGGLGDDTLTGGLGSDVMSGGLGADTFVFRTSDLAAGQDVILDFKPGADRIALIPDTPFPVPLTPAMVVALFGAVVGDHVELHFGPTQSLAIFGIHDLLTLQAALAF